jgi:hypothetical protein
LDELQSNEAYIRSNATKKSSKESLMTSVIIIPLKNVTETGHHRRLQMSLTLHNRLLTRRSRIEARTSGKRKGGSGMKKTTKLAISFFLVLVGAYAYLSAVANSIESGASLLPMCWIPIIFTVIIILIWLIKEPK